MVRDYCFEMGPVCSKPVTPFLGQKSFFLLFGSWSDYGLGRRGIGPGWTWSTDPVCQVTNWSTTCSITWYYVSAAHIIKYTTYIFAIFNFSFSAKITKEFPLTFRHYSPHLAHNLGNCFNFFWQQNAIFFAEKRTW